MSSHDRQNVAFPPRRAPYAADPAQSRGRRFAEPGSPTRTDFQRDRDRIIHSTAFRRLAHKTQVFVPHEGDHYRTRLTHSMEVGQIARAIARVLGLDDDLAEALALAHDLGHTPFGHTGEDVLDDLMRPYGGFDHNAQALRIVTKLERRYADFDGLNLAWETLEGLVKHNGPLIAADGLPIPRYAERGLPIALLEYDAEHDLELGSFASAEAQAAALADDIAYNAHDIDDGLRAGLFDFSEVAEVDFLRDLGSEIEELHPNLERPRLIHELVRRVITHFIEDAIAESQRRLAKTGVQSAAEVRAQPAPVIAFTQATESVDKLVKSFLFQNMYRHPHITRVRLLAADVVSALFAAFFENPEWMPADWAQAAALIPSADETRRARLVCDYIAGMTDRYALAEHTRLFDVTPDLR
ncbi:deoxyguanosinetriphosphate triphosphohydrolase [Methylovirgula sp. HY1]|uniref:deoxyguanosinetriphosphate triphosphohydrolase n=1 Tax=Methylovirgula sp. HY1 TaxID=2822761 RepID=UPI001C5BE8DF|nr:deoxyguanosinetriphosphate triphosphohydrolase [Methylovirgula sp. HY1]QXX74020.1 Deoxyguanosinetriphosphate triphosphohydrolase-like protein [Methylovirgula sp. HY1]